MCDTDAEVERLGEVFGETQLMQEGRLHFVRGRLAHGFRMLDRSWPGGWEGRRAGCVDSAWRASGRLISAAELFHRQELARPSQRPTGRAIDSFLQLREGDLVVHLAHGIGRYRGHQAARQGRPAPRSTWSWNTPRARGSTSPRARSSWCRSTSAAARRSRRWPRSAARRGCGRRRRPSGPSTTWPSTCCSCRRPARPGPASRFPPTRAWQQEFDAAFPYQETPDQLTAIDAIKADMQQPKPMDRLLCGDVGFGKTELAIRAAFKAIDAGYQVAVLVPTTILAEQHRRTFTQRMAEFPFKIAAVSRFCTAKEEREILEGHRQRQRSTCSIGTHRLASPDVKFQNLGLVIIDEEQRFGVAVKERLKALRASVDVLTMTATPIPRTLHMSLLGVRSISNLETAPKDRLAVETRIARFDDALIRHADPARAEPRRADLLRPQPRAGHPEGRPRAAADRARGPHRHRPRADERDASWKT